MNKSKEDALRWSTAQWQADAEKARGEGVKNALTGYWARERHKRLQNLVAPQDNDEAVRIGYHPRDEYPVWDEEVLYEPLKPERTKERGEALYRGWRAAFNAEEARRLESATSQELRRVMLDPVRWQNHIDESIERKGQDNG